MCGRLSRGGGGGVPIINQILFFCYGCLLYMCRIDFFSNFNYKRMNALRAVCICRIIAVVSNTMRVKHHLHYKKLFGQWRRVATFKMFEETTKNMKVL